MFGIQPLELLVLGLLGFMLFGEKLPQLARDAARLLHQVRTYADGASRGLRDELGPEYADLDVRDLHPRTLIKKHVVDAVWVDDDAAGPARPVAPTQRSAPVSPAPQPGAAPSFDPDAT